MLHLVDRVGKTYPDLVDNGCKFVTTHVLGQVNGAFELSGS